MTKHLKKIESGEALAAWREQLRGAEKAAQDVRICMGGSCLASGAPEIAAAFKKELAAAGLAEQVPVRAAGCMGPCVRGPVLRLGDGTVYQGVKPEDAAEIVREHLVGGRVVDRLIARDEATGKPQAKDGEIPFFTKQTPIVLRNCGKIDPERIEETVARDGYAALAKVLGGLKPE